MANGKEQMANLTAPSVQMANRKGQMYNNLNSAV
jgi:hypothetical protein